jgi:S1-C subfamily serine protease
MDTKSLSQKTVKILSQKISINWLEPYKNTDTHKSIGTGFFINDDGYILTCSHVVAEAKKIHITIPNYGKEKIEVEIVGICPDLDLALLKTINFKNEDYYQLHETDIIYNINPGGDVYAIGFPLGQDNIKYTKGIISGRQNTLIQTDTPINRGNSGGPLLLDNKVIGINTSGILRASNVGYATPISYFHIIKDLLFNPGKNKMIKRPFLGLLYQKSNQALIDVVSPKCNSGIYVKKVFKNSPISKSGLKKGDIIQSINNIEIDNFGFLNQEWFNEKITLSDYLKKIKNNEIIKINYFRQKKLFKKSFRYDNYKLTINKKYEIYEEAPIDYEIFGGFIVMELTQNHLDKILEKIDLEDASNITNRINNILKYLDNENKTEKRLIITHIFPNSIISNSEVFNEFDIINKVNNIKCINLQDYRNAIKKSIKINKDKFIEITSETNKRIFLLIKDLLNEEEVFYNTYKYNLSNTYYYFKKNNNKTHKKTHKKPHKKTHKKSHKKHIKKSHK